MKRNRFVYLLCILAICVLTFTGCEKVRKDKKLIVCTIYPEYDWLINVLGDKAAEYDIRLILDGSTDLHSYQPTASDIAAVSSCDMIIYVGGESDSWIEDALEDKINEDMVIIDLMEVLGDSRLIEEEIEGMQTQGIHHEEEESDEHVWLSLRNAQLFTQAINDGMKNLSPDYSEVFANNSRAYITSLGELDEKYIEVVSNSKNKHLIFADRFPFRYFVNDYDLKYYAAFSGCSAETEASFKTVTFIAGKMDELELKAILKLENSDENLANTILKNSNKSTSAKVLTIDSMQSISKEQREGGYNYLSAMESNLDILIEALN